MSGAVSAVHDRERAALAAHPELLHLAVLRDRGGWRFLHRDDEPGVTVLITGVREWPDGTTDALGLRSATDAQAVRLDPEGEVAWKRSGTLVDVVGGLLELAPPCAPHASRLVLPGPAPALWLPGR